MDNFRMVHNLRNLLFFHFKGPMNISIQKRTFIQVLPSLISFNPLCSEDTFKVLFSLKYCYGLNILTTFPEFNKYTVIYLIIPS